MASSKRKDNKGRVLQKGENQRKDGTYMYRYTDQLGKRQCVYASTLKELREKENAITVRTELGLQTSTKNITLEQLIARYYNNKSSLKKSTSRQYDTKLATIRRYPISKMQASKIKVSDAKQWVYTLFEDEYQTHTIINLTLFVKSAYKKAIEDELLYKNPFEFKLDFLPPKNKRTSLTQKEQDDFLLFLKSKKKYRLMYDATIIMLGTGLRAGELSGLTESDIDLENKLIHVTKQLQGRTHDTCYIERTKTQSGVRTIPMNEEVYRAVEDLISYYHNKIKGKEYDVSIDGVSGFIVRSRIGGVITPDGHTANFKYFRSLYNKTHETPIYVTPHILRHTYCTNLMNAGMSLPSVQYLMGHAWASTTLDVYTHTNENQAVAEYQKLMERQK